jgi:hypothetical protein
MPQIFSDCGSADDCGHNFLNCFARTKRTNGTTDVHEILNECLAYLGSRSCQFPSQCRDSFPNANRCTRKVDRKDAHRTPFFRRKIEVPRSISFKFGASAGTVDGEPPEKFQPSAGFRSTALPRTPRSRHGATAVSVPSAFSSPLNNGRRYRRAISRTSRALYGQRL